MNSLRWLWAVLAAAAVAMSPTRALAQVFTPTYLAPRISNDVGVYLSEGPGDLAAEGILRRNFGGTMLGLRLGIADLGDTHLTIGGDVYSPLSGMAPVSLGITAGAQAVVGDLNAVGFSVGASLGYPFVSPGLVITPYVHPRLGIVNGFGQGDEFDTELLADFGVNLDFNPRLSLRLGIGLADATPDWGIGLAWR